MGKMTYVMDDINAGIANNRQVVAEANSIMDGIKSKFASATEAGFLTDILNPITKETSSISGSIDSINKTINVKTNEMFDRDIEGEKMFNDMKVYKDFYAENDAKTKEYNNVLLNKMDSKSVKEGEVKDSTTESEFDVEKEGLTDILGQAGKVYDEQKSNVQNVEISNINVGTTDGISTDTDSKVINQALGMINQNGNVNYREGDNAVVVDANLANVNNGPVITNFDGNKAEYNVNTDKKDEPTIVELGKEDAVAGAPATPLATSAYEANIDAVQDNSIGAGLAAGLAGLAGLAGVAGMAVASKDSGEEEEKEEKKDN